MCVFGKKNKIMKIKKTIIIFIAMIVLLLPSFAFAQKLKATDAQDELSKAVTKTGVVESDITVVGGYVLKAALALVAIVFFIIIFYGGFKWLLARGNEESITKAKSTVIGAIIGLLIVVGAYAMTNFITSRIISGQSGSSTTDKDVPDSVEGDPTGCCLDRWETEGGFAGVGQSGWTGSLLTKAQCDVLVQIKDYSTQDISIPEDGQWVPDLKGDEGEKACQKAVQIKIENSEWEFSDKWENAEWNPF